MILRFSMLFFTRTTPSHPRHLGGALGPSDGGASERISICSSSFIAALRAEMGSDSLHPLALDVRDNRTDSVDAALTPSI